ncbi:hypothetical protein [Effusibacillus lacus]|uniref:Uncharacterized protein n=1 Tax=Effusibacillus lacus TaxID=1348429 RepID=A0A292YJ40_9BACL|nr:hypothetical protein [Effusibacillus lacus]TCS67956.1 hypothetical protein EDD64_1473 [Effusibacillus lacus]GAX88394.1 hypothetical protein EFBL_0003 [Effusibacillus lacus]
MGILYEIAKKIREESIHETINFLKGGSGTPATAQIIRVVEKDMKRNWNDLPDHSYKDWRIPYLRRNL